MNSFQFYIHFNEKSSRQTLAIQGGRYYYGSLATHEASVRISDFNQLNSCIYSPRNTRSITLGNRGIF